VSSSHDAPEALSADRVSFRSDVSALGMRSSSEVEPCGDLGDARGARALSLALNMRSAGYHAYVCGIEGPARLERVAELVKGLVQREGELCDWVYVHAFASPDRPRALRLASGDGRRFERELGALIRNLREDLPRAFREEAFDEERARLIEASEQRQLEQQRELEQLSARAGFGVMINPQGNVLMVPLIDGRPAQNEQEIQALGAERLAALDEARKGLARELRDHLERRREEQHHLDDEIHGIEREFAERIVRARLATLASRFATPEVATHLEELGDYLLDHLDPFRGPPEPTPFPFAAFAGEPEDPFRIYSVNVVVDSSRTGTAPVVVVDSPTYKNLFGSIDRTVDRTGRFSTDFTRIHAGALLEADGGVLVLSADDALVEPFVWRILRRSLRSGRVEIEAYDPFVGFTPAGIRPAPIRVSTKVVLVGPRWLYELLLMHDEEFGDLFKILADSAPVVERTDPAVRALCGRVARVAADESLPAFEASALDALVELAVREAEDRTKLRLGSETVLDAAREGAARAVAAGHSTTTGADVRAAIRERVYRLDRIEQAIREAISRGVVRIDVEGSRVGQVNALAVSDLGRHAFARPTRVTATVGIGMAGLVSIDRETRLSGAIHSKGVLILEGFLRSRFAREHPLSLVASLVFEQSYSLIDGDSASLAELLSMLSRVGGFPLRQSLAVTGSIDQNGQVQAVGGVNEKVEGFFDCCRVRGLSGDQGVVLPRSNVEHLVLREDVVEAIAAGRFHVWAVDDVESALAAMTGREPGATDRPGTLMHQVGRGFTLLSERSLFFGAVPHPEEPH
jgi:ATP-dependent Lon protease